MLPDRVHAPVTQHEHPERFAKQARECILEHVEAAGVRAECGHHQAVAVPYEAASPHRPAATSNGRRGMEMTSHLAFRPAWRRGMAKRKRADFDRFDVPSRQSRGVRVVVTRNPHPVSAALQRGEGKTVARGESLWTAHVMERVAERDDAGGV